MLLKLYGLLLIALHLTCWVLDLNWTGGSWGKIHQHNDFLWKNWHLFLRYLLWICHRTSAKQMKWLCRVRWRHEANQNAYQLNSHVLPQPTSLRSGSVGLMISVCTMDSEIALTVRYVLQPIMWYDSGFCYQVRLSAAACHAIDRIFQLLVKLCGDIPASQYLVSACECDC